MDSHPKGVLSKRMVLITCVCNVMRLKSLGLIDNHVKIEFLRFNLLSSSFFNKFVYIICISIIYYLKTTLILTTVKYFCCQSVGALKECFLAISQLEFNAFSHFSEVSLQIIYLFK